jgi:plastocyanin
MATKTLKAGDKVKWGTSQGETHGTVVKKETKTTKVKGHTAKASKEEPQYRVKSDKSGKEAVHKPEELKKA